MEFNQEITYLSTEWDNTKKLIFAVYRVENKDTHD